MLSRIVSSIAFMLCRRTDFGVSFVQASLCDENVSSAGRNVLGFFLNSHVSKLRSENQI